MCLLSIETPAPSLFPPSRVMTASSKHSILSLTAKMPSASSAEEDDAGSPLPTTDELSQALAGSDSPDSPPRTLERSASQLPSPPLLPTPPPKASCKATKTVTGGSACPSSPLFSRLPSSLSMASAHLAWLQLQTDSHLCLCLGSAGCRKSSYEAMVVERRLLGLPSSVPVRGESSRLRIQGLQSALRMETSLLCTHMPALFLLLLESAPLPPPRLCVCIWAEPWLLR